jgi:hypothetical protein
MSIQASCSRQVCLSIPPPPPCRAKPVCIMKYVAVLRHTGPSSRKRLPTCCCWWSNVLLFLLLLSLLLLLLLLQTLLPFPHSK